MLNRTAIICDDDPIIRELLRAMLRSAGMQVVEETSTGERALAAYKKLRPDVVCLDICMPGTDGLEVLRRIRDLSKDTVVLVISGQTTNDNVRQAIEAQADGVIAKPFNTARVTAAIRGALQRRSQSQRPEAKPA